MTGVALVTGLLVLLAASVLDLGPDATPERQEAAPSSSAGADAEQAPARPRWQPPGCKSDGRNVLRPVPRGAVLDRQWAALAPPDGTTYELSSVVSTAYPADVSALVVGTEGPAARTCVVGGTLFGRADARRTWDFYHDRYNAACLLVVGREWLRVSRLRCDNVEDGIRPQEAVLDSRTRLYVTDTYLTRIRDDCLENDEHLGGVLYDNLWESCNTGISERPWQDRSRPPASGTLVLDHMLIGLYETPHEERGRVVMGENALFKWSSSGNRVVIRCSVFKVDSVSLNGTDAMAVPEGTVVDDRACPDRPSTIVWLGGGRYPADTAGLRVTADRSVWDRAVAAWKERHPGLVGRAAG